MNAVFTGNDRGAKINYYIMQSERVENAASLVFEIFCYFNYVFGGVAPALRYFRALWLRCWQNRRAWGVPYVFFKNASRASWVAPTQVYYVLRLLFDCDEFLRFKL